MTAEACAGYLAHPFKNDAEKPRSDGLGRPHFLLGM